jgi:KUP system potassium uptake protein
MDEVITPDLASLIYEKVRNHIVTRALERDGEISTKATGVQPEKTMATETVAGSGISTPTRNSTTSARLETLERAYNREVLYIIGKEQMKVKVGTNLVRRFFLKAFLFIRENSRAKIASLDVPMDKVIEVGFVKDV